MKIDTMNKFIPISVIIPCYNCLPTIDRAIESVINQTTPPFELILIEDCTPDNGSTYAGLVKIADKYSKHLSVKLLKTVKNMGPASARNLGIKHSSSEYIAFLDADDTWHPQKLELQYDWMIKNPTVHLCGHDLKISRTNLKEYESYLPIDLTMISLISRTNILMGNTFSTPTVMIKKSDEVNFLENQRTAEDYFLWMYLILKGYEAHKIKIPLAFSYKNHFGEGGISSNLTKMELGELKTYLEIYKRGQISLYLLGILWTFSLAKHLKRCFTVGIRKI